MAENLHLADLWVAVVPDTSKVVPAVDEAGKKAKTSFSQSVRGIGDALHDEISKGTAKATSSLTGVGGKIKDIFHKTGIDSGKAMFDGFNLGAKDLEKVPAPLRGIAEGAAKAATGVHGLGDALGSLKGGDVKGTLDRVNSSMQDINKTAKQTGIDMSGLQIPQSFISTASEVNDKSRDIASHFNEARDSVTRLGQSGGGLSGLIGKMGELGTVVAAVAGTLDSMEHASTWLDKKFSWYKGIDDQFKNNPLNRFLNGLTGSTPDTGAPTDAAGNPLFKSGTVSPLPPSAPPPPQQYPSNMQGPIPPGATRGGAPITPRTPNFYRDWYGSQPDEPAPAPAPTPSRSSGTGGGGGGGGRAGGGSLSSRIGTPSSRSGVAAAGSRIANLYAFANSLVGTPYSQDLRNDCSGMVSQLAAVAIGLPPPAAGQRFSTPNEGQWLFSHGFEPGLGGPNDLNIGWNPAPGNSGHTAATLPGGINAESGGSHGSFLLGNGAAGASDKFFSQHAHLSMGSMSDSGGISGGQAPTGREHDPLYVTQTEGGSGGEGSSMQSQGQQLGQGLMNGVLQMFGIDGSVFGGKSPLDWGAVKLGGGLLNYGMGLMNSMSGGGGGPMGTPGLGGGGGGGLGGLAGLIPGPGAAISAAVGPGGGSYGIGQQSGAGGPVNVHNDNSVNVMTHSNDPFAWTQAAQFQQNAQNYPGSSGRTPGSLSGMPVPP